MIKTLLLVSSIIGGVGLNASPSLNEKAQKEIDTQYQKQMDNTSSTSEQPHPTYNLTIQPEFKKVIHTEYANTVEDNGYYYSDSYLIQKNQSKQNNAVWSVNASKYTKNLITKKQNKYDPSNYFGFFQDFVWTNFRHDFNEDYDMDLYALQLDQVNTPDSTNLKFQIQNTTGLDIWNVPQTDEIDQDLDIYIVSRVDIFNTSDTYAQKYIDATINSNSNFNNWWSDLSDSVSNEVVQTKWINTKIAEYNHTTKQETNYTPVESINVDLTMELGTTNYVYIKVVRQLQSYVHGTQTPYSIYNYVNNFQLYDLWGNRENGYFNYYFSHNNIITLSGTYTPGTAMEVIDLPGLIFTIVGLPFTFLSTAFNLTLFPNTPYSINISSFIWTILGIVLLLAIIRLILRIFK